MGLGLAENDVGQDLARPGIRFLNREPGSGSRQLLDRALHEAAIPAGVVSGYATTAAPGHFAVAEAIASGLADAGVGSLVLLDALTYDPFLTYYGLHAAGYAIGGAAEVLSRAPDAIANAPEAIAGLADAAGDVASSVFETIVDIISGLFN